MTTSTSNYVGSYSDYESKSIIVWERDNENPSVRSTKIYPQPYYFYVKDPQGEFTSIFGDKLKRLDFETDDDMKIAARQYADKFESTIQPEAKILMNEYYERPTPVVNFALFDIENDYSQTIGYATMDNPYAPINAVTVYQSWTKQYFTYIVPPKNYQLNEKSFQERIQRLWKQHRVESPPNVIICVNEEELLVSLLNDIQSADIISGWNSEFFDLPYTIKRLLQIRPKLVNKLCFPGCKAPRENTVERFGNPQLCYQLYGRSHLDYLDLFKKFTFEGRVSYSLGNIAEEELDVPKLDHDGSLEQLYKGTYFPDTNGMSESDIPQQDELIQQLNLKRALIKQELVKRKLMGA